MTKLLGQQILWELPRDLRTCIQAIHKELENTNINFSIVRFGISESSGSVIPKFKKQIKDGGPITLTHEDVTRYFMTVTKHQLVIQAGAMGKIKVFVLDMGESVRIKFNY